MKSVGIHEAKTTLSHLIRLVSEGEDVTITNNGVPVAQLVAVVPVRQQRIGGVFVGSFTIPHDFDDTPSELIEFFT